jgi:hypothetical protein
MEDYQEDDNKKISQKESPYFTKKYWDMYYDQLDYKQIIYLIIIVFLLILFVYFIFFRKAPNPIINILPSSTNPNFVPGAIQGTIQGAIPNLQNKDLPITHINNIVNRGANKEKNNSDSNSISQKLDHLLSNMNSKIEQLEKTQKVNSYAEPGKFMSKGEAECRRCAEEIFGTKFKKGFPKWLISDKKRQMEIDVYNEKLKIGIEYNGEQHYNPKSSLHKNKKDFENLKRRDILKRELCDKNGVYLITVPYTVPLNQIKDYILYYLPENHQKRVDAGMSQ